MHQAKHIPIVNHRLRRSLLFLAAALLLGVSLSTHGESDSSSTNLLIRHFRMFDGTPAIFGGGVQIQNSRASALGLSMGTKGGRGAYYVMIFAQSGGFIPKTIAFISADPDRMEVSLPVPRFGPDDCTAVFVSLPGHFSLRVEHLKFQNKPGWKENSEWVSEEL